MKRVSFVCANRLLQGYGARDERTICACANTTLCAACSLHSHVSLPVQRMDASAARGVGGGADDAGGDSEPDAAVDGEACELSDGVVDSVAERYGCMPRSSRFSYSELDEMDQRHLQLEEKSRLRHASNGASGMRALRLRAKRDPKAALELQEV